MKKNDEIMTWKFRSFISPFGPFSIAMKARIEKEQNEEMNHEPVTYFALCLLAYFVHPFIPLQISQ